MNEDELRAVRLIIANEENRLDTKWDLLEKNTPSRDPTVKRDLSTAEYLRESTQYIIDKDALLKFKKKLGYDVGEDPEFYRSPNAGP